MVSLLNQMSVTRLCEIRYSVGANSFALKIRHGFTEDYLKPSSNFISGKKVLKPMVDIGVNIVRMNSHLQLSTRDPKEQLSRKATDSWGSPGFYNWLMIFFAAAWTSKSGSAYMAAIFFLKFMIFSLSASPIDSNAKSLILGSSSFKHRI